MLTILSVIMLRRKFLRTGIVVGSLSMSGCLGRKIVDQDEWEEKNSQLTAQKQTVDSLHNTIDEKESTLAERDNRIQDLESRVESLESEITTNQAQGVSDYYDIGYEFRDIALEDYNDGSDSADAENYATAALYFARANGNYDRAERMFKESRDRAAQIDESTVTSHAEDSMNYCHHMGEASFDYANAYDHYSFGEWDEGDADIANGNEDFDRAQDYQVRDSSLIKSLLGI